MTNESINCGTWEAASSRATVPMPSQWDDARCLPQRDREFLPHALGTRTVEPATGPAPAVHVREDRPRHSGARLKERRRC
jgi:hypothetical protein